MENRTINNVESAAVSAIAAASKTPFKTSFKITLGIGLGHLTLFVLGITSLMLLCLLAKALFG